MDALYLRGDGIIMISPFSKGMTVLWINLELFYWP